jgi:hypothetical protein
MVTLSWVPPEHFGPSSLSPLGPFLPPQLRIMSMRARNVAGIFHRIIRWQSAECDRKHATLRAGLFGGQGPSHSHEWSESYLSAV